MWFVVFVGVIIGMVVWLYNRLVQSQNQVKNAFSQIDVQLQRRHDLIPNLVETARAYMQHEKTTLTDVIAARQEAVDAKSKLHHTTTPTSEQLDLLSMAERRLSQALTQFKAVMEQYPVLQADRLMRQLMEELSHTENRIGFARQAYNDHVMFYNNHCQMFPSNLIAGAFSFRTMRPWTTEQPQTVRAPVQVSF